MVKTSKRILALLLSMSFLFVAGCKKKKEPLQRVVLDSDPYYSCEEIALSFPEPEGKELDHRWTSVMKVLSDCVVMDVDEEYVVPRELEERWNSFQYDPSNVEEYKKLLSEKDEYRRFGLMVFGLDGSTKNYNELAAGSSVLCVTEDLSGKGKILITPYVPEVYVYGNSVLYEISPEGELTNPITLDRSIHSTADILFLENGNMLCRGDSSVLLYDPDGNLLGEENFGFGNNVNRLFKVGEKYYAYFLIEDIYDMFSAPTTYMYEIDPATGKKVGDRLEVTCPVHSTFLLQGKDGVYAILSNGFRKYDLLNGKDAQTIFSWKDADCNYSGIESTSTNIVSEDDIYTLRMAREEASYSYRLMHLHRQETNPHAGENIIYLGTIGTLQAEFIDHINQYNLETKNHTRIVVLDYSGDDLYSTEYANSGTSWIELAHFSTDQTSLIADQVYLDILGGDGPDILLNFGAFSQFNTERALVDLNTLIDGSMPLDRTSLFDNVIRANEKDGKLYQIPLSFAIDGMFANQKYVGERTGWTYEEFREIDRNLPDGVKILGNVPQSELLENLMDGATGHIVDYNKQTVDFDNQEFREILDIVKTYGIPKTRRDITVEIYNDETLMHDETMLAEGILVATGSTIQDLYNYANVDFHCSDPIRFIGYPSPDGTGARADTAFSMAITRSSQYKDEAWGFVRSFFEEDVQLAIGVGSFPVNRKAFDDLMEQELEEDRKRWEEAASDPEVERILRIQGNPLTEDDVTELLEVVENIREARSYDPTVMMIIQEEAPGYLTGQRTVDDVVSIIQKRSKAVVQERG